MKFRRKIETKGTKYLRFLVGKAKLMLRISSTGNFIVTVTVRQHCGQNKLQCSMIYIGHRLSSFRAWLCWWLSQGKADSIGAKCGEVAVYTIKEAEIYLNYPKHQKKNISQVIKLHFLKFPELPKRYHDQQSRTYQ